MFYSSLSSLLFIVVFVAVSFPELIGTTTNNNINNVGKPVGMSDITTCLWKNFPNTLIHAYSGGGGGDRILRQTCAVFGCSSNATAPNIVAARHAHVLVYVSPLTIASTLFLSPHMAIV